MVNHVRSPYSTESIESLNTNRTVFKETYPGPFNPNIRSPGLLIEVEHSEPWFDHWQRTLSGLALVADQLLRDEGSGSRWERHVQSPFNQGLEAVGRYLAFGLFRPLESQHRISDRIHKVSSGKTIFNNPAVSMRFHDHPNGNSQATWEGTVIGATQLASPTDTEAVVISMLQHETQIFRDTGYTKVSALLASEAFKNYLGDDLVMSVAPRQAPLFPSYAFTGGHSRDIDMQLLVDAMEEQSETHRLTVEPLTAATTLPFKQFEPSVRGALRHDDSGLGLGMSLQVSAPPRPQIPAWTIPVQRKGKGRFEPEVSKKKVSDVFLHLTIDPIARREGIWGNFDPRDQPLPYDRWATVERLAQAAQALRKAILTNSRK